MTVYPITSLFPRASLNYIDSIDSKYWLDCIPTTMWRLCHVVMPRTRGEASLEDTIRVWPSMKGKENIFPYSRKREADACLFSCLSFMTGSVKTVCEPHFLEFKGLSDIQKQATS